MKKKGERGEGRGKGKEKESGKWNGKWKGKGNGREMEGKREKKREGKRERKIPHFFSLLQIHFPLSLTFSPFPFFFILTLIVLLFHYFSLKIAETYVRDVRMVI